MSEREVEGLGPLRSWHRFRWLWPEIAAVLGQGYSMVDVHAAVVAEALWEGSYEVFRRHVTRARREGLASSAALGTPALVEDGGGSRGSPTTAPAAAAVRPAVNVHELWSRVMNPNAAKGPYVYGADDDE